MNRLFPESNVVATEQRYFNFKRESLMKLSVRKFLLSCLAAGSLLSAGTAFAADKVPASAETQAIKTSETAKPADNIGNTVNINTATAEEIKQTLIGIGAKKAEAIIQYREKHGNFTNVEQLLEIQGIGEATLDKNKDRIKL